MVLVPSMKNSVLILKRTSLLEVPFISTFLTIAFTMVFNRLQYLRRTNKFVPVLIGKYFGNEMQTRIVSFGIYDRYPIVNQVIRQYSKKSHSKELDSDSDSEDENFFKHKKGGKHVERGTSLFWRRKMRTIHNILDVNKDGLISFEDLKLLASKFNDLGHLSPEFSKEFLNVMKEIWQEQFGEITDYNLVTVEQFLTDYQHRLNDPDLSKKVGRFLPYLFKAVDINHSGYLDLCQYKLFFRCLGLSDDDAAVSFAVIDRNSDGKLSMEEFVKLGKEYFFTEDERKISRMFWGPLIDN